MKTIEHKSERIATRVTPSQKEFIARAASLRGRSLTDFIIFAAQEKAKKIILEQEQIIASQKDSEIFFDAIVNSPKANVNLTNAAKEYKNLMSK